MNQIVLNKQSPAYNHDVTSVRVEIDRLLSEFFIDQVSQATILDPAYGELWASLQTIAEAGGKRLRPYLTVLGYEAYGGKNYESILQIGLTQELLHLALLVHDDIADKDYIRHGVVNVAGVYRQKYSLQADTSADADHYASSSALLAGDLALSAAHSLILESQFPLEAKAAALAFMRRTTFEVAAGQLLDMEAALAAGHSTADYLKIARLKTASYSCVGPLLTGAMLAGALAADLDYLEAFAYDLGVSFQLADDLLGVFGDELKTGKSASNDIREGKRTYLAQQAFLLADNQQLQKLQEYFGKPDLTLNQAETVRQIMEKSGAKASSELLLQRYADQALRALAQLHINDSGRRQLVDFVSKVASRDS